MDSNLTEEQAIALFDTGWWKSRRTKEIVDFQLFEARLCVPFGEFHAAVEKELGRPVFTHEFANVERLQQEHLGHRPRPTFAEIVEQIPEAKLIVCAA